MRKFTFYKPLFFIPLLLLLLTSCANSPDHIQRINTLGYGSIQNIQISQDQKTISIMSHTGIRIFDITSFTPLHHFTIEDEPFIHFDYSPDGNYIAAITETGSLYVWNVVKEKIEATLYTKSELDMSAANDVIWSPDGNFLAAGSTENKILVWDSTTWQISFELIGDYQGIRELIWSTDGRFLTALFYQGVVNVWDVSKSQYPVLEFGDPNLINRIYCAALSSDDLLAISNDRGEVEIWDLGNLSKMMEYKIDSQDPNIFAIRWSPNSKKLVSELYNHRIHIMDILEGSGNIFENLQFGKITWSPDGKYLLTGSTKTILWDIENGKEILNIDNIPVSFHREYYWIDKESKFVSIDSGDNLFIYDIAKKYLQFPIMGYIDNINSIDFSLDSKILFTANSDGRLREWDISSGEFTYSEGISQSNLWDAVLSPDGKLLAIMSSDELQIRDSKNLSIKNEIEDSLFFSEGSIKWSPDGKMLAVYTRGDEIRVYDSGDLSILKVLPFTGYIGSIYSFDWSPEGNYIAIGDIHSGLKIWNTTDWAEFSKGNFPSGVQGFSFSPSGNEIAISQNYQVDIFDLETWEKNITINSNNNVELLTWSPDGKFLAAAEWYDKTIDFWDLEKISLITTINTQQEIVQLVWSPDGKSIAARTDFGTIEILEFTF